MCSCNSTQNIPADKFCNADTDCVPASCCHAKDVVNLEYAPNCERMFCTMNCEPGTLDCGQAEIKCSSHQCTFTMN